MRGSFNYFIKQRDFVLVFRVFIKCNKDTKGAQAYFFFPCRSLLAYFSSLRSCWRSLSRGNLVFITNTEPPPQQEKHVVGLPARSLSRLQRGARAPSFTLPTPGAFDKSHTCFGTAGWSWAKWELENTGAFPARLPACCGSLQGDGDGVTAPHLPAPNARGVLVVLGAPLTATSSGLELTAARVGGKNPLAADVASTWQYLLRF